MAKVLSSDVLSKLIDQEALDWKIIEDGKKIKKTGMEFKSNRGSGAFRSSRITRGGFCHIEIPEHQPIYPHGGPNHEKLIPITSPRPNFWVDPPPTFSGPPHRHGVLDLCMGY